MLQPKPELRATVEQVLQHPWVLHDLPPGSLEMNDQLLRSHEVRAAEELVTAQQVDALVDAAEVLGAPGEVAVVPL